MRAKNKDEFVRAWMEAVRELKHLKYSTMDLTLHKRVDAIYEEIKTIVDRVAEETYGPDISYSEAQLTGN